MADSTPLLEQIEASQAQKEVTANGLFAAGSYSTAYGAHPEAISGLTWAYYGTRYGGATVASGTNLCDASNNTYMVVDLVDGAVSFATNTDDWNDSAYGRCYKIIAGASSLTWEDHRMGPRGVFSAIPAGQIPQNSQSAAYTTVLSDAGRHLLHPSADTTARTFTIDSNANVPYPLGTVITFVNQASAGSMTIAITSDTMRLAGAGSTGSRTLAANGVATALKLTTTEWIISGTGLT